MDKITINGERYIKIMDLRKAIAGLRKTAHDRYEMFNEGRYVVQMGYSDILSEVYKEELANAHTPDEIRAVYDLDKEVENDPN